MKKFKVEIEGVEPLLMHSTRSLTENKKDKRGAIFSPDVEAELGLYYNNDGKIIVPGDLIIGAIKAAAVDFKVAGKGKKTYKQYIEAGLRIDESPLIEPQEWIIDTRPVVIRRDRILRSRPKFNNWRVNFIISVLDESTFIDAHDKENAGGGTIKDIIVAAGQYKGLGDYRPRFGRFEVKSFEAVD